MNEEVLDKIYDIIEVICVTIVMCFFISKCTDTVSADIEQRHTSKDIKEEIKVDTVFISNILSFHEKAPKEGLMEALEYYDIKHKEIVYAQAILETGHFKSNVCNNYNNLFGLYNSNKKAYFKFNSWVESVEAYNNMIQNKYKEGDYYEFLDNLGYAEDIEYTNKLKRIVKREFSND